ncbi:MAG: SPOR domain-containing protein [Nevskiales bacterium]
MNEVVKRRAVGASVLAALLLLLAMLFFKRGDESAVLPEQASDLADVRTYAIDIPAVPEQPPQEILAEGPPIGTLLPAPEAQTAKSDSTGKKSRTQPAAKPAAKAKPVVEPVGMPIPDVGWSVQVGSFATRGNADGLQKKLKGKGYPAFVYRNTAENPPLFRVRVGPYMHEDEAQSTSQRLREELRLDVKVVANG